MRASLPMYDRPELSDAHRQYWAALRQALKNVGIDSPAELDKDGYGLDFWADARLVFSQTCGCPYKKYLHNRVGLVATPDYAIAGCPAGYYRSYFVIRKADRGKTLPAFIDSVFAYNELDSQSGYVAAWNHLKPRGRWFRHLLETGSHINSVLSVASMEADIASIDAMTWQLIDRYDDVATELMILEKTIPTPGLPYITSLNNDTQLVYEALLAAIENLPFDVLRILGLRGIVRIPEEAYLDVPLPSIA